MIQEGTNIALPEGYRVLPLHGEDGDAPIRICVIARSATGGGTPFCLLRETVDASIYLGCLIDRAGDPKTWIEIWVQNIDHMAESFRARLEALSNPLVDQRWFERLAMFRKINRNTLVETGWETVHPSPTYFDPRAGRLISPVEAATSRTFTLCTEDDMLVAAGLAPYTASLHRYLWNGPGAEPAVFVATTAAAPAPAGIKTIGEAFLGLVPFNPSGGFLLVRLFGPIDIAGYADLLGGRSWSGPSAGSVYFDLGGAYSHLQDANSLVQRGAHLFSGRNGSSGLLREVFHLKLNLVVQALSQTREAVRSQQMPMLNLNGDSFRVRLSQTGTGLPFFWTALVELVESSAGVTLPVETSESRYFIPPAIPGSSIYRPQTLQILTTGEGLLRIREILPPVPEGTRIEATLASDERLGTAGSDLIHLRLSLPIGRVDLYGHADKSEALAKGENRIRTLPQKLPADTLVAIQQAAGVPIRKVHFEILPMLASPCDMYALGVLAVRLLLVDEETNLSVALDQLLSLAQQVSTKYSEEKPFPVRLRSVIDEDPRWHLALGPHRLTTRSELRELTPRVIPNDLWWETIGIILRLFPGTGPDSFCRDFGDAPALALERIFDRPLAELEVLQACTRSLVVTDWDQNLEIHEAISAVMAKQANQGVRGEK
jgi:hypothetical protein